MQTETEKKNDKKYSGETKGNKYITQDPPKCAQTIECLQVYLRQPHRRDLCPHAGHCQDCWIRRSPARGGGGGRSKRGDETVNRFARFAISLCPICKYNASAAFHGIFISLAICCHIIIFNLGVRQHQTPKHHPRSTRPGGGRTNLSYTIAGWDSG